MTDLIAFLKARLDETERLAELQPPWPWKLNAEGDEIWADDEELVASAYALSGGQQRATAAWIVRHDPAHVLADIEAKRAIIDLHQITATREDNYPFNPFTGERNKDEFDVSCSVCGWVDHDDRDSACTTLRLLALPFASHPDYQESWRP